MSIANFAVAEASLADTHKASGAKKPPSKRQTVALPDTRLAPEAR